MPDGGPKATLPSCSTRPSAAAARSSVVAIAVVAVAVTGCSRNNKVSSGDDARLVVGVDLENVNHRGGSNAALGKVEAIVLEKLLVTLNSSVSGDSVVRDTIHSGTRGFSPSTASPQQLALSYELRPLRSWTIELMTLDVNDSVVHFGTETVENLRIGETRAVIMAVPARYVVYSVRFTLPDSIGSQSGTFREKLNINRLVVVVDGDTVRDTTHFGGGYFPASPAQNLVEYHYARAGIAHDVELYLYGHLNDWPAQEPLYSGGLVISSTDSTYTPVLNWTGPNAGVAGLLVTIGAVPVVDIEPHVPLDPLP
jgi:hypothetical protein